MFKCKLTSKLNQGELTPLSWTCWYVWNCEGRVWGGYSSLVLVGMCHHRIWKQTHTNTNFSRKSDPFIYQLDQFSAKFWAKSSDFPKIFLNLSQFWKIDPFIYQILHFIKGHSYTKRLILLPMLAAHPRRVFYTEYPRKVGCGLWTCCCNFFYSGMWPILCFFSYLLLFIHIIENVCMSLCQISCILLSLWINDAKTRKSKLKLY